MIFFICIEPTLKALLTALHPARASWYKIGLEMDIPHTELDCFEQKYSDPTDLMCEVLKYWFKTAVDPCPSWEAVVRALRSPLVNEMNVAVQLESKYCTPHKTDESNIPTKMEIDEGIVILLFYDLGEEPNLFPDGIRCGDRAQTLLTSQAEMVGMPLPPPLPPQVIPQGSCCTWPYNGFGWQQVGHF